MMGWALRERRILGEKMDYRQRDSDRAHLDAVVQRLDAEHTERLRTYERIKMFEPEKLPPPDENGFFCHPDVPGEEDEDVTQKLSSDFSIVFVSMDDDAPQDVVDAYFHDDDLTAPARWTPTAPRGEGWVLVAKYDTESGPYAMFVRPNAEITGG